MEVAGGSQSLQLFPGQRRRTPRKFSGNQELAAQEQPVQEEPVYPVEEPRLATYSGTCGQNVTWSLDTTAGVLTISGSGAMYDFSNGSAPWYADCSNIQTISIEDGVTSIGGSAFFNCGSLTSIEIPSSVTSIGEYAFSHCNSLTIIEIPNSVMSIGNHAFYYCRSLTSIEIPNSVTSIGNQAFYYCRSLTSVTIGNGVSNIGSNVFEYCNNLAEVHISDVAAWCKIRFADSYSNPLTYAHNLYLNGELVSELVIPNSVASIGNYALYNCTSITSITIGSGVTTVGTSAFAGCENLKNVYYVGMETDWDTISIGTGNGYLLDAARYYQVATEDTFTLIQPEHGTISTDLAYAIVGETITVHLDSADLGYVLDKVYVDGAEIDGTSFMVTSAGTHTVSATLKQLYVAVAGGTCGDGVMWALTAQGELHVYGNGAMYNNNVQPWNAYLSNIRTVIIEEGVTSIGAYAFFPGCANLTSVTIPNSVTSIGNYAFSDCLSLTSVTIGNGMKSIGSYAFQNCNNLKNVYISDLAAWLQIGFANPSSNPLYNGAKLYVNGTLVSELVIPESITTVMPYSLCYESITIPATVKNIATNAFSGGRLWLEKDSYAEQWAIANRITYGYVGAETLMGVCGGNVRFALNMQTDTLTISGSGPMTEYNTTSYSRSTSTGTTVVYIPNTPWYGCRMDIQHVIIEDGVTSVGTCAFYGCEKLESVAMPESVISIGNNAFYGCSSLTAISIPNGKTTVGNYAFSGCNALTVSGVCGEAVSYTYNVSTGRLTIRGSGAMYDFSANQSPQWVGRIPVNNTNYSYNYNYNYNYNYSTSLGTIVIESGVTSIGSYAFAGCNGVSTITIPNSVTQIGDFAFYNCNNISLTIPASVMSIGQNAFYNASGNPVWVTKNSAAEAYVKENKIVYGYTGENVVYGYCGENVSFTFNLNEGLLLISGSGPMFDYSNGSTSYQYQYSSQPIVNYAPWYRYGSNVQMVRIEEGVTRIGSCAFYQCTNIRTAIIPESVTSIDASAFTNNYSVLVLVKQGSAAETYAKQKNLNYLYLTTYSGTCGENVTWSLDSDSGVLTIRGNGDMQEYNSYDLPPWSGYYSIIKEVVIENGVTSIGSYAFRNQGTYYASSNQILTSVSIPKSVTSIGDYAFYGCTGLKSISIPNGVERIGEYAFCDCTGFTSITLPAGLQSVEDYAFARCSSLKSITLPTGLTGIGNYAFSACQGLTYVSVPDGMTSIGDGAFSNCQALTGVRLPETLKTIGAYAFDHCIKLASINLPSGLTKIGGYAFYYCIRLKSVQIPSGVQNIGAYTFYYFLLLQQPESRWHPAERYQR